MPDEQGREISSPGAEPLAEPNTEDSLSETVMRQDSDASAFGAEFIRKVIRIRGVRIERAAFLRQELRKLHLDDATIELAVSTTPVQAGLTITQLDALAGSSITFETSKAAALSFSAGLPGGFAMLATVPADITQYYVHAFRVMQKIAYFYGWKDFIADLDDVDDETLGKLAVFLGVMLGVQGASASLTTFASQIARPAIQKQISQRALTKTAWYGPVKSTLKLIGIKVTKDSFAKTVTKAVPVASGVISGGMTIVALRTQSQRLRKHLRELPPPGVDAAAYRHAVDAADALAEDAPGKIATAKEGIEGAAGGAVSGAKGVAKGAWGTANAAGGGILRRSRGLVDRARGRGAETEDDVKQATAQAESGDHVGEDSGSGDDVLR